MRNLSSAELQSLQEILTQQQAALKKADELNLDVLSVHIQGQIIYLKKAIKTASGT